MSNPYLIDCGGQCRSVWEVHIPDSYAFAGQAQRWMVEEAGWSRSMTGAWICPDCTRQEDSDHA